MFSRVFKFRLSILHSVTDGFLLESGSQGKGLKVYYRRKFKKDNRMRGS